MSRSLSPQRAEQIRQLFDEALERPPEARAAYLDQACRDDEALRREVEALIEAHDRADDQFHQLDHPVAHTPDRLIGQRFSHYEIIEKLGGGGMGVVYEARDTKLDRTVALKFLPPHQATSEEAKRRFIHEAKAASALDHPHIGYVHEIDQTDDGRLFIAMAFYGGETLKEKIARGPLPVEEAVDYAVQVAEGLQRAHEAGIVHRDVKPANVMVTDRGRVKIVDFGLAKVQDVSLTRTGTTLGTAAYMSPEQARGEAVDHRTDLWSLGVVLYEMLTGQRPFRGTYEQAIIYSILNEEPEAVTALRNEAPSALDGIVRTALAKTSEERYPDAEAFRSDLHAVLRSLPGAGEQVGASPLPPKRLTQRQRLGIAFLAVVSVLLLAVVITLVFQREDLAPQAISIRAVTAHRGEEWGPGWSPDGTQIAYSLVNEGSHDVAVRSLGGGEPHIIVSGPYDDVNPRWSPDGSKIMFTSDRGAGVNLYWVPPTGGAIRKLAETHIPSLEHVTGAFTSMGALPWSPDAQEVLFPRLQATGELAIWKVNVETLEETQLTFPPPGLDDLAASFSFDGTQIAFVRDGGLWSMPAGGGEPRAMLNDEFDAYYPAWTPDNRHVVFTSTRGGQPNIWELDVETNALRRLTTGRGWDAQPNVASDGRIVYVTWNHQLDLYWLPVDDPDLEPERITEHSGDNFGARVSPDGTRIVYFSNRTGNHDIWLHDRTTGRERQLTDHTAVDVTPDWSPDGEDVVFYSTRGGYLQLWALRVEGGAPRLVTEQRAVVVEQPTGIHFGGPRWSPDGEAIGFLAPTEQGGRTLWLVDPDGQNLRPSILSGVLRFAWYRSSRKIIYTRSRPEEVSTYEVRVADLETGEEELLLTGMFGELTVAPDGSAIAYVEGTSHFSMNITVQPLSVAAGDALPHALGPPRELTDANGYWHVHNGGWSPDSKAIVYTRDEDWADIFLIDR